MEEFFSGLATPCKLLMWFYAFMIPFTAIVGAIMGAFNHK